MNNEFIDVQTLVDRLLSDRNEIKALEAGCGSASYVHFQHQNIYWVGLDISEKQLQRNTILDQKVLGDVQSYVFPPLSFDIVLCWDVLEHLPKPELALINFVKVIKENGLIILKLPNPASLKGLLVKYSPHYFHVFCYRHIMGFMNAGKDDVGPFRTYLKFSITPSAIRKFAANNKLAVIYLHTYNLEQSIFQRFPWAYHIYQLLENTCWFPKSRITW